MQWWLMNLENCKHLQTLFPDSSAFSVSSNSSAVEVKVNNQAEAKAFNAQISVSSLAKAQTLEFSGFSSKTQMQLT